MEQARNLRMHAVDQRSFCALILAILLAVPAQAAELRLTINGARSDAGQLLIGLYSNSDGFEKAIANATKGELIPLADRSRLIGVSIRTKAGAQSTIFTRLPPGRYAALVIHDENDDSRLNKDAMGMPTEGYGFTNNARGFFSAPAFDAAAVTIGNTDVSTAITLIYQTQDRGDASKSSR